MRSVRCPLVFAVLLAGSLSGHAQQGETVKIAFIDPLSGPFANVGQNQLRSWQLAAQYRSGPGNPAGVRFQVVGFDNKGSPQESLNALKVAIDQGFRYIAQGNSSSAAAAILETVNRHNARRPGKPVLYLNYAAVDPALTNERCSHWHFRFDADTTMKMEALTTFMKDQPGVRKVYLINQNYAHGQQVARYFREGIQRKRPDVAVVGDVMHPLGQVKDFAPYVQKIRESGADTIVTGNWGADLSLLVKALSEAGLKIRLFTYYASVSGTPTALAQASGLEVLQVNYGHSNPGGEMARLMAEFRQRFGADFYTFATYNALVALGDAMAQARSTEPAKVAQSLSGLTFQGFSGPATLRATDHQLLQGLWISRWQKVGGAHTYSVEDTGYTFAPLKFLDAGQVSTPSSCEMKRP